MDVYGGIEREALRFLERDQLFWNRMVRHEQPSDDFAVQHVPLHDLGDIVLRTDPVPHAFRIDYDTWAEVTMIEATGFVGSDNPFEI
jgi:hypothetical protein